MRKPPDPHYRHRFPAELISHVVWLYHVFGLSFRDVELILAERGVIVSYESIRRWCLKFGASFESESWCLMLSIGRAATSTIARRIRIDQPGGESGRCRGSNRRSRHSASCRPTLSSMATSVRGVTGPQPGTTGPRVPWPSRSGPRRRAPKTQHNRAMVAASSPNTTLDG
jgi:hypothetical protein